MSVTSRDSTLRVYCRWRISNEGCESWLGSKVVERSTVHLTVELSVGTKRAIETTTTQEWVPRHHEYFRLAYQMVEGAFRKLQVRWRTGMMLQLELLPGERVLVHIITRNTQRNLAAHWEEETQIILGHSDLQTHFIKWSQEVMFF